MGRRWLVWTLAAIALFVIGVAALWYSQLREDAIRERIRATLAARFNADVAIEQLNLSTSPSLRLTGGGITMRVRGRPELPPFISIDRFVIDLEPFSIVRRHVDTVHIDGLKVQVPPEEARQGFGPRSGGDDSGSDSYFNPSKVIIEHLISHDAELSFISSTPNKRPHVFIIHNLELTQLGFDRAIPFRAQLVNPVPVGLIDTQGSFGPWVRDDPAATPVNGQYTFSDANLSTIDAIHGTLSSTGSFRGRITSIDVTGTTDTPDFNLDLGGRPLPLHTVFEANVDGTNGTTILKKVDARLRNSGIVVTGAVVNLPGHDTGHMIDLHATVAKGRIEDMLALVAPKAESVASGDIALQTKVHLPPGHTSTLSRLLLDGTFTLRRAIFKKNVQERVREFSRRTQGKSPGEMENQISSDVKAGFVLGNGVMNVKNFSFSVPGATVSLDGTCNLRNRALDLHGLLQMQASVSQAVGGFKSIFLRIVDPFFRKHGRTVVPIKIGGMIESPDPKLDLGRK
jgi:hypothetical protein